MKKNYYWLSWYEKSDDYRPLTYPPNAAILGWWKSGERCSDDAATLCASVVAESEAEAWEAIRKDWPQDDFEIRFCNVSDTPAPTGDRFILEPWIKERLEAVK